MKCKLMNLTLERGGNVIKEKLIYRRYYLGFGISDQKNHQCHVKIAQDQSQYTLEKIIINHMDKDAIIRRDGWSFYETFIKVSFMKTNSSYHTNSVESVWNQMKLWINSLISCETILDLREETVSHAQNIVEIYQV